MPLTNETHFSAAPTIQMQRSVIPMTPTHTTTFNFGDVIPLYVDADILPGDTVQASVSKIVRLQTLLTPTFGDMYFDTMWFFVPHRLVWEHWKEFCGENTQSAWVSQTQYTIPSISSPSGGFATGTIADYMGLPVGVSWNATDKRAPMALPFRAYALTCNDWFRSEVVTDPLNIPIGDSNQTGSNGTNYINDVANGGMPFKAAKFFDYFTSCVPQPQKGNAVTFPLISGQMAPVVTGERIPYTSIGTSPKSLVAAQISAYSSESNWEDDSLAAWNRVTIDVNNQNVGIGTSTTFNNAKSSAFSGFKPANLWADLSSSVGAVTVNELRLAFQLQKFYERMALSGTRYTEIIESFFSTKSPDARLQRPEYLGGNRITINVHEVTNSYQEPTQAGVTPTAFLGDLGAKSATADVHDDFIHSFTEHGTLLCLGVARYQHSYSGMHKMWSRKVFTDLFWPTFASLGMQPVYDSEIYADSNTIANDTVFGYNLAWEDYHYIPSRYSGEMRPGIANSLASWHLGDYYTQKPTLSDAWIREDKTNVDRVLAVTSQVSNQLFGDFLFDMKYTRVMPAYCLPGLIDHF